MKQKNFSEWDWIHFVKAEAAKQFKQGVTGIGDDCAIVPVNNHFLVFTNDTQVENVHFNLKWSSPFQIGLKGVTAAYSDLSAKGVRGGYLMLTTAFSNSADEFFMKEFWRGVEYACSHYHLTVIGGNTTRVEREIFFDFFITGITDLPIPMRHHAVAGDIICIIGQLGLAAAGLQILQDEYFYQENPFKAVMNHFIEPLFSDKIAALIYRLSKEKMIHASMDISDGLFQDLHHILQSSNVNAEIEFYSDLIHPEIELLYSQKKESTADSFGENNLSQKISLLLKGGEDYVPLFTVPSTAWRSVKLLAEQYSCPLYSLGQITAGPYKKKSALDVYWLEKDKKRKKMKLPPIEGFTHF